MICRNCGFQNAAGDAFCGSCGQFLEWSAQPDAGAAPADDTAAFGAAAASGGATDTTPPAGAQSGFPSPTEDTAVSPAVVQPPPPPVFPRTQAVPMTGIRQGTVQGRPQGGGSPRAGQAGPPRAASSIVCWNCGRTNPASRSFCQQCGEKLVVAGAPQSQPAAAATGGGSRRALAIGAGLLVVLLLAGGAAAVLFGGLGGGPAASPTLFAGVSPSAGATTDASPTVGPFTPPAEASPSLAASSAPLPTVLPPTVAPGTQAPTAAPATAGANEVRCRDSSGPTAYVNITRDDPNVRVPRGHVWCVHEVIVVPHFGSARVRLVTGNFAFVNLEHFEESGQPEYVERFRTAIKVFERSRLRYAVQCYDTDCAFTIQVGYDQIAGQ